MKITFFMLRNWRPPALADGPEDRDQQKLKSLFPFVLVTRHARCALREKALTILNSTILSDEEALEALLMFGWSAWSKAISERATQKPFVYFFKEQMTSGKAFQISDFPEIERELREALSLPVPKIRLEKPQLAHRPQRASEALQGR